MDAHSLEQRYSRHLSLPEIGEAGQTKLANAKVLVIGVGGLGCPLSLYLAASGIGTLGLVDDDRVSLSNLNRQILFETADVGRLKTEAARDRLEELNPDIHLKLNATKLTQNNAEAFMQDYDLIVDGSDNVETRYTVNQFSRTLGKPLISAAIHGWEGQLYHFDQKPESPCYQCLYPDPPLPEETPTCAESGVLSPLAGLMGCWQAAEVIKSILGLGIPNHLQRINLLTHKINSTTLTKDSHCALCS